MSAIVREQNFSSMLDFSLADSKPNIYASFWINVLAIFLGSLAVVASAKIYIPLPFTPVPITAQTLAILTISSMMGSKRAPLAVLLYALYGILGFPVFAEGRSGLEGLYGATGGYLFGFVLSAYVVGKFCEKGWDRSFTKSFVAMLLGQLLIFVPGLLWLGQFVGYSQVLEKGFYPFVIGGAIKTLLGATTSVLAWKCIFNLKSKKG